MYLVHKICYILLRSGDEQPCVRLRGGQCFSLQKIPSLQWVLMFKKCVYFGGVVAQVPPSLRVQCNTAKYMHIVIIGVLYSREGRGPGWVDRDLRGRNQVDVIGNHFKRWDWTLLEIRYGQHSATCSPPIHDSFRLLYLIYLLDPSALGCLVVKNLFSFKCC